MEAKYGASFRGLFRLCGEAGPLFQGYKEKREKQSCSTEALYHGLLVQSILAEFKIKKVEEIYFLWRRPDRREWLRRRPSKHIGRPSKIFL
jgi:hypothetical protein